MVLGRRTFLTAAVLASSGAWAQSPQAAKGQSLYSYLAKVPDLPPPPETDAFDALMLVDMKPLRTPERVAEIRAQADDPTVMFWRACSLDPATRPDLRDIVLRVQSDVTVVTMAIKLRYNRRRPSVVNPSVDPVIPVPWHASYPNGHATQSRVMAHLFSQMVPGKRDELFALAERIGMNREVAGLHYITDTDAGVLLGDALWDRMGGQVPLTLKD